MSSRSGSVNASEYAYAKSLLSIGLWSCLSMPNWSFQNRHSMLISTPALALVFKNCRDWSFITVAGTAELWQASSWARILGTIDMNNMNYMNPDNIVNVKRPLSTCRHNCMAREVVRVLWVLGLQCSAVQCFALLGSQLHQITNYQSSCCYWCKWCPLSDPCPVDRHW